MMPASPARFPARNRTEIAIIERPAVRGTADVLRPTFIGTRWLRNPATVMEEWRPREIAPATPARSLWTRVSTIATGLYRHIADWRQQARCRQELLRLDDYALRDIGVSRFDVYRRVGKPFRHE
jgi:uncharacterized protein YjiS (DUF1127 family)